MINGLQLVNIGCHADTRITFGPLTAIVGQNGTGKTTVLKALEKMSPMLDRKRSKILIPREKWARNGGGVESRIFAAFEHAPKAGSYVWNSVTAEVTSREDSDNGIFSTLLITGSPLWMTGNGRIDMSIDPQAWKNTDVRPISRDLTRCIYLKVHLDSLREPSYSPETYPSLKADGSMLSTVLANLMASDRLVFEKILSSVREVVPVIRDIRAKRCPVTLCEPATVSVKGKDIVYTDEREVQGHQLRFDTETGKDLPASSISDGTLYVLALSTLIHTAGKSSLILLDDIEQGLHPSAQRELVKQIKRLQELHDCQIVLTTHSPYVIDELEADQVWLLSHAKEGSVAARKLSDHPRAAEALKVLTTGEFWTSEGENWL